MKNLESKTQRFWTHRRQSGLLLWLVTLGVVLVLSQSACTGVAKQNASSAPLLETSCVPAPTITQLKNFAQLNHEVWRSEQPTRKAFQELADAGLKSVLNLREYHNDNEALQGLGIQEYHIKLAAGKISEADLEHCLRIIQEAPKPLLIHCWHGSDRTGAVCAAYRIVFESWTKDQALREMTQGGYGFHGWRYPNLRSLIAETDFAALQLRLVEPAGEKSDQK